MAYVSGNPALNSGTFRGAVAATGSKTMTLSGVAIKSFAMLILCLAAGGYGWTLVAGERVGVGVIGGFALVGFLIALVTTFRRQVSPFTTPVYVAIEGFVAGGLSEYYNSAYPGIAEQALLLETAVFGAMLVLFLTRVIRVTQRLVLGVAAATGAVALYYIASLVIGLFTHTSLPLINSNSAFGIGFSLVVIGIAAFNLVVDFGFIETGVEAGAPKYMEWYATFGLFVTLIWLYFELLRLLAKLRSR